MDVAEIDFILSHFEEPLFPRKMMTAKSNGQFSVSSREEIFEKCKQASFIDCRINAYPEFTDYRGIVRYDPNFVFIDLDLSNFSKYKDPRKALDRSLKNTLKKISSTVNRKYLSSKSSDTFNIDDNIKDNQQPFKCECPTVLWTGNGYHIYLPIQGLVLDQIDPLSKYRYPNLFSMYDGRYYGYSVSEIFLKFAENFFTDGKADQQHRPKFKTCLIRIPDTYNSKCLSKGLSLEESKIKLVQKWNGYRLRIELLTKSFWRWLTQEEINERLAIDKRNRNGHSQVKRFDQSISNNFQIIWIEQLLQKGIPDGRKETLRLILGPYLAKRKRYEDAVDILQQWLDKCNAVKPLEHGFNPKQRIKTSLKNTKGFSKLENLKVKHRWLYDIILDRY
jgi:hypothetical protein